MKKRISSAKVVPVPQFVLGIEGGGTRTTWALIDKNRRDVVIKQGEVGPGNVLLLTDKDLASIAGAIHDQAGVDEKTIEAIGATFAGVQRAQEKDRVRRALAKIWLQARIEIAEDTRSALVAAHGADDGICVIAGTGSNVVAQQDGRMQKAGGWGHLFSDHGSAYALARNGLEAVYAHYDETQQVTKLGQIFLRTAAQNTLEDLVGWMMARSSKVEVAALAPCVFEAAKAGDKIAKAVLQEGAEKLAQRVHFLAKRLKWKKPPVGLFGGLFVKSPEYAALVRHAVQRHLPGSPVLVVHAAGALAAAALVGVHAKDEGAAESTLAKSSLPKQTPESIARASTEQRNPRSHGLQKRSIQNLVDLFIA